jgi:hypothetical protein
MQEIGKVRYAKSALNHEIYAIVGLANLALDMC